MRVQRQRSEIKVGEVYIIRAGAKTISDSRSSLFSRVKLSKRRPKLWTRTCGWKLKKKEKNNNRWSDITEQIFVLFWYCRYHVKRYSVFAIFKLRKYYNYFLSVIDIRVADFEIIEFQISNSVFGLGIIYALIPDSILELRIIYALYLNSFLE